MPTEQMLQKYAELIIKVGLNLQKGQPLVIHSPIECAQFARLCATAAYKAGASEVITDWSDELMSKITYQNAALDVLTNIPDWFKAQRMHFLRQGAASLSIDASDPDVFADVDPTVLQEYAKARRKAIKAYSDALMANHFTWCVVSVPTEAWAKKVFPGQDNATERLWEAIAKSVRLDTPDPVAAWRSHNESFARRIAFLNEKQFRNLHYKNAKGTDFTVGLADGHVWCGGAEKTIGGIEFTANMPTEEIFTTPHKDRLNGALHSSLPLNHNGVTIDDFSLTFKDGKVIDCTATKGEDLLRQLLGTDDGARSLGEVALIPCDSPISRMGILFYNTLFDENASCHFALGQSYPGCMQNGENASTEQLQSRGANDSLIHIDFMIGTSDLCITGTLSDGTFLLPVFRNGNWAF